MGKLILAIVAISFVVAIRLDALIPSKEFSQTIADCKAMSDVTFIVEGRFKNSKKHLKQISKFDTMRADRNGLGSPPKPIYSFQADVVHLGRTGVTNNKTGKQMVKSMSYTIREGEAPEGLQGKGLICYKGSNPRTIKSVHSVP